MPLNESQRRLRAQIGANEKWAHTDPCEGTRAARTAFEQKFLDAVDPDRLLPEAERLKRAQRKRKAYFQRLALESSIVRTRRVGDCE